MFVRVILPVAVGWHRSGVFPPALSISIARRCRFSGRHVRRFRTVASASGRGSGIWTERSREVGAWGLTCGQGSPARVAEALHHRLPHQPDQHLGVSSCTTNSLNWRTGRLGVRTTFHAQPSCSVAAPVRARPHPTPPGRYGRPADVSSASDCRQSMSGAANAVATVSLIIGKDSAVGRDGPTAAPDESSGRSSPRPAVFPARHATRNARNVNVSKELILKNRR